MLSTFDYETSARATLSADVVEDGKTLVSGRMLADISRALPSGKQIDFAIDGARVSLTCGSARFTLQTMPVDEYPTLPEMPTATGTVDSAEFAKAVTQAVTAAGKDDMLPVLTGVRIEIEGSTISLLATDRFRLSLRELSWNPRTPDETVAALVPAKVLAETAKSLTSGSEVSIALSSSGTGEASSASRARPPAACAVRPRVFSTASSRRCAASSRTSTSPRVVDRKELIDSVKRVALVAERNTAVQMAFADGQLTLDAGSGDEAQASEPSRPPSTATTSRPASTRSSCSTA